MELNKQYTLEDYHHDKKSFDENDLQAWEVLFTAWDKSDALTGYCPHKRYDTFTKYCEEHLPKNYTFGCVAEHTGIADISLYKES